MDPKIIAAIKNAVTIPQAEVILENAGVDPSLWGEYINTNSALAQTAGVTPPQSPVSTPSNIGQDLSGATGVVGTGMTVSKALQGPNAAQTTLSQANLNLSIANQNLSQAKDAVQQAQANVTKYGADTPIDDYEGSTTTYQDVLNSALEKQTALQTAQSAAQSADNAATQGVISASTKPSGIAGIMQNQIFQQVMSAAAAAAASYMLFDETEQETQNPTVGGGFKTLAAAAAAFFALYIMYIKFFMAKGTPIFAVHYMALLVAGAVEAAIVVAAVIAGKLGGSDAPTTSDGAAAQSILNNLASWYQNMPTASVTALVAGLTVSGISYNISPGSLYRTFTVPTVQLTAGLQTATGQSIDASTLGSHIFYEAGAGPNGSDLVIATNNNGTTTSGLEFYLDDKTGYLIGPNGPATNYLPFFQPTMDASGKVTGYQQNSGAFNALLQIPACSAIANDTSMTPQTREAALETCMRNNKNTQFIPLFN